MSFKELLINSLKRRYKNQTVLQEIFDDIKEKLYQLEEELEEFTRYGLDVDLDINSSSAKLAIEDYYLIFELYYDYDPPFIHLKWGKKDGYHSFDQIELKTLSDGYDIDRAFDYYLHKAFNDLLKELN